MKRRKIVLGLSALAGGALLGYPGYKWMRWNQEPDLDYLDQSRNLLASIIDTIIPRTDSPGASDCGVHDFIIKMIKECTDTIGQNKFLEGLRTLDNYSQSAFGRSFQECSADDRIRILYFIEGQDELWPGIAGKIQKKYLGSSFFIVLKKYCVIGYCTSEGGATRALRYSPIPSSYVACMPYVEGDKAWATF